MNPIMLVERRHELELLRETFADCLAGRGRVALISGGLASGKTELLHAFSEQVVERGALLLTATGARVEQSLRMGVVWQLFRGAELPPEVLERVSQLVSAEPLVADDNTTGQEIAQQADTRAVHGICALLLELAKDRPVVIAVDDVQFVDAASLEVLRCLRCRMRSANVLLALTEWERPNLARPPLRAEVTRQPHLRIALGTLSEAGVAELVSRRLDADTAARLAPSCYALGGGNPFLTHALIEDQCRPTAQQPRTDLAVGAAFREAVLDCLHRWDPEFLRIAGGMAILADHTTPELVGELLKIQPHYADSQARISQVFDVLTAAGLVESGQLRHAEIAATVLASLPPAERSRLHARAAELLYHNGVDATEVARHVTAVDSVPEPWVVQLLRHAADQSLAEDAGLAIKYLELALLACDDERERVALHSALVRAAWRVNPAAAARHLPPLQDALRAGELAWRDAVPVIRQLLWQGNLDAAAEQLRTMNASAGQAGQTGPAGQAGPADGRIATELRLAGEWIYGRLRDRLPDDVHAWPATADGTGSGFQWRRTATSNTLWIGGSADEDASPADVVSAAEHILQGCLGDVMPEVGASALLALEHAGRGRRAMFWCDALSEEAARQGATTWQAVLGCVRADLAWRRGDLVTAQVQASAALSLLHTQSWGVLIGYPLSILILVNTAMGRYDAAAELLDRAVPEAMFDTAMGLRYLHASGHYNLASGRPLAAMDDFERCGASMRRWGLDIPAMIPWRSDLAQAYLELGMRIDARTLVAEQLGRPAAVVGPRAYAISLRVLAGCGEPAERVRMLREAAQVLRRCGDQLELARTLTELAEAYRELGDLGNVRQALRWADEATRACHAGALPAPDTRRSPEVAVEKADERAAGVAALSEAEQKVATLAANGHSNREIGRKLYITVSTVEQHLTRVYRKLNVSRRTDLLSELSRHDVIDQMAVTDDSRVLAPR